MGFVYHIQKKPTSLQALGTDIKNVIVMVK